MLNKQVLSKKFKLAFQPKYVLLVYYTGNGQHISAYIHCSIGRTFPYILKDFFFFKLYFLPIIFNIIIA